MRVALVLFAMTLWPCTAMAEVVVDFESLPVNAGGYFNGDTRAGAPLRDNYTIIGERPDPWGGPRPIHMQQWEVDGVRFSNEYLQYDVGGDWVGWSWSNVVDVETGDYTNQYASYPGGGSDGNGNVVEGGKYAVGFDRGYFDLPDSMRLQSMEVTNTTYAGVVVEQGNFLAKPFGGDTGSDPDLFMLTLTGYDAYGGADGGGLEIGAVEVRLADYTFDDNALDYIVNDWIKIDLTDLRNAKSVGFTLSTTDIGLFGPNTPTYFAMDNLTLTAVPEPSSFGLLAFVGAGVGLWRRRRRSQGVLSPSSGRKANGTADSSAAGTTEP